MLGEKASVEVKGHGRSQSKCIHQGVGDPQQL
jgi:hypothetical protein